MLKKERTRLHRKATATPSLVKEAAKASPRQSDKQMVQATRFRKTGPVQTKLTVGPTGDCYEREADRVARAVVAFLSLTRAKSPQMLRSGKNNLQEKQVVAPPISAGGGVVAREVESAIRHARGGGRMLPTTLRENMELAFGVDFSRVKIHCGPTPDRLNRHLGSLAFTTGKDIFLRKGFYRPANNRGKEILAHELTHVVQQGHG